MSKTGSTTTKSIWKIAKRRTKLKKIEKKMKLEYIFEDIKQKTVTNYKSYREKVKGVVSSIFTNIISFYFLLLSRIYLS